MSTKEKISGDAVDKAFKDKKDAGNVCMKSEDYEGAIQYYTDALKLLTKKKSGKETAQSLAVICSNRSIAYLKLGRFENALDDAEACVQAGPRWWKSYFRLGEVFRYLGEYMHATTAYARALEISFEELDEEARQSQAGALQDLHDRHLAVIKLAKLQLEPAERLHPIESTLGLSEDTVWMARGGAVMLVVMTWILLIDSATSVPILKDRTQMMATVFAGVVIGCGIGWLVGVWRYGTREMKLRPPSVVQELEKSDPSSASKTSSKPAAVSHRRGSRGRRRLHRDEPVQE